MDKYAGHFSSNTTNLNRSDTMSTTRQSQYVCDIRDLGSTDDVRISRVREKSDKIRNLTQQLYGCDIGSKNVMPPSPNMISTDKRVSGVQIQRQETQNYGQVCQVDGNCGLTVPITEKLCENVKKIVKIKFFFKYFLFSVIRAVEQTIQEPCIQEKWEKKILPPESCTKQIKLECNQKVVVQGEKVRKVQKEVPVSRKIMVKKQVPVRKKITRLVCVPVVKTIEVETTDVKEVTEFIEEVEERWEEKIITEMKKVDEYIKEPYQKVVTIPFLQIQEVKRQGECGKEIWEKKIVRGSENRTILKEQVFQEDVLASLKQQEDKNYC